MGSDAVGCRRDRSRARRGGAAPAHARTPARPIHGRARRRPRQRPCRGAGRPPRRCGIDRHGGAAGRPGRRGARDLQPARRARAPDPGGHRRGRAGDPLREAARDHDGGGARGRRRVPGGRGHAPRGDQPLLRRGLGSREAPSRGPGVRRAHDLGDGGPAAQRPLSTQRSPSSAPAGGHGPRGTRPRRSGRRRAGRPAARARARGARPPGRARPGARLRGRRLRRGPWRRSATRSASVPAACACC